MGRRNDLDPETQALKKRLAAVHEARQQVIGQFGESLRARDLAGDRQMFARRVAELLEAERTGDPDMLRAALMEVTLASGEWCVTLDASRSASFPALV